MHILKNVRMNYIDCEWYFYIIWLQPNGIVGHAGKVLDTFYAELVGYIPGIIYAIYALETCSFMS